jgi:hypothetical protein
LKHCVLERTAQSALARGLIRRAVFYGFRDEDLLRIDPDLKALRDQ